MEPPSRGQLSKLSRNSVPPESSNTAPARTNRATSNPSCDGHPVQRDAGLFDFVDADLVVAAGSLAGPRQEDDPVAAFEHPGFDWLFLDDEVPQAQEVVRRGIGDGNHAAVEAQPPQQGREG